MLMPVRCTHCRQVYDQCDGEMIARYADCTVYKAPCCGRTVDDRRWKAMPDIQEVYRDEMAAKDKFGRYRLPSGKFARAGDVLP